MVFLFVSQWNLLEAKLSLNHTDWYIRLFYMEIILVEFGLFLVSNASVVQISERESEYCMFLCLVRSARGCLIIHNFHLFFPSFRHRIKRYHLSVTFVVWYSSPGPGHSLTKSQTKSFRCLPDKETKVKV